MHRRIVQRILSSPDAQETGTLLIGGGTQALDFQQLVAGCIGSVHPAVFHYVLRKGGTYAGHISEQMSGCGVQIDSHTVHAGFHHVVQLIPQCSLIHIILVLPHSERLRVNFHKFSKRVHQPSAYGNSTPYGHIIFRKFLPCHFGCRIDGCPVLTHSKDFHTSRFGHPLYELLSLTGSSAVAYGYDLDSVLSNHRGHRSYGLNLVIDRRMREYGFVMQ